jgi:hypothetical protein
MRPFGPKHVSGVSHRPDTVFVCYLQQVMVLLFITWKGVIELSALEVLHAVADQKKEEEEFACVCCWFVCALVLRRGFDSFDSFRGTFLRVL